MAVVVLAVVECLSQFFPRKSRFSFSSVELAPTPLVMIFFVIVITTHNLLPLNPLLFHPLFTCTFLCFCCCCFWISPHPSGHRSSAISPLVNYYRYHHQDGYHRIEGEEKERAKRIVIDWLIVATELSNGRKWEEKEWKKLGCVFWLFSPMFRKTKQNWPAELFITHFLIWCERQIYF